MLDIGVRSPVTAAGKPARAWSYAVAVLAALIAGGVRLVLDPLLGVHQPFVFALLAVVFMAWQGGLGPALTCLGVSASICAFLFLPPRYSFAVVGLDHQLSLALFCFVGVACAWLGEFQRAAQRRVEGALLALDRQRRELEQEVNQRRLAEKGLSQNEARFRLLSDAIPQMVWTADPTGAVLYCNQRWYNYTGLTPEESRGQGWQQVLHPEDREAGVRAWREAVAGGDRIEIEQRLRRGSDGTWRWHLVRGRPLSDAQGNIVQWVGTITDIDDQKREKELLEEEVRQRTAELTAANAALTRSNQELEQFASVASHDLQEPLRKIQTFGDRLRLRCGVQLDEQGKDYLQRMHASATRMRNLIDALLTYARVTTKAQPFVPVDLGAVARDVVGDLEGLLQQAEGRVEVGELPTVDADPLQMRQLFQNLIANGLKFHRPEAKPVVRIEGRMLPVDGEEAGPRCEITVADNGIGFEEVYLDRIFQLFQRLHGRNEYEGTGLGLAICRKIVLRHNGHITARSTPGQGATFIVTLPVKQSHEDSPPPGAAERQGGA
jgi:PAS domain S-box-containing protein